MSDRASRDDRAHKTWPNPVRTLLLLIAGFAVFIAFPAWVGGTGGFDPTGYIDLTDEDSGGYSSATLRNLIYDIKYPAILLLAAGLIAAFVRAGRGDAEAAMHYALGSNERRWMPGAARFWTVAARVTAWAGLLLGIATVGYMELQFHRVFLLGHPMSQDDFRSRIWTAQIWALFGPLAGVLCGRIILGSLAGGARLRADASRSDPVFSRLHDLALAALFAIPWYLWICATWRPAS